MSKRITPKRKEELLAYLKEKVEYIHVPDLFDVENWEDELEPPKYLTMYPRVGPRVGPRVEYEELQWLKKNVLGIRLKATIIAK